MINSNARNARNGGYSWRYYRRLPDISTALKKNAAINHRRPSIRLYAVGRNPHDDPLACYLTPDCQYLGVLERFCREKREVIIRIIHCIGTSLPIDGTSGGEVSIEGLPIPHLMAALQGWKTRGAPTALEDAASSSDDTLEDSSSSEDEHDDEIQPGASNATRCKPRVHGVAEQGRAGSASRGRGCGKNQTPAHLTASPPRP